MAGNTAWSNSELDEACAALEKVLASPIFSRSWRQQRFLRYVVNETISGRADKLKGYSIGVEVFDREQAFDPAIDAIVRVEAARLRAKLREYYDGAGHDDPLRFDLPKGSYTVRILRKEDEHRNTSPQTTDHPHLIEDRPSLAVVPFANISGDPAQEYFADGFTDCLITEVSRLPGIFIISRQSSFIYKNALKLTEDIGEELGVRYLLEGSVQRAGEWVRITAKLVDTLSGAHVWAERYDRELKDIFALQDDVTRRIATVLHVKLAGSAANRSGHGGTASVEALDAMLHGLERFWVYTSESAEEAITHFSNAIRLDSGYAVAHAWLARTLIFQWVVLWDPRKDTLDRACEHARMAVNLYPQLPYAHCVLGWTQCWRREGEAAIASGRRAVALDQNNADAYFFLGITLAASNLRDEAMRYVEQGLRLNPHTSAFNQHSLGFCLYVQEEYEAAIAAFKRSIEISANFLPPHILLSLSYSKLGRMEEAHEVRDKVLAITGGRKPAMQIIWLDDTLREREENRMKLVGLL